MIHRPLAQIAFLMGISMVAGAGETTSSGGADSAPAYESAQVAGGTLTISTTLHPNRQPTDGLPEEFVKGTYLDGEQITSTNRVDFHIAKFNEPGAITYCRIAAINRSGAVDLSLNGTFSVRRYAPDNMKLIVNVPGAAKSAIIISCYRSPEGGLSDELIRVTPDVIQKVFGNIARLDL